MKKKYIFFVFICLLTAGLSSCKKDEAAAPTFATASVTLTIQNDDGKGNITPLPDAQVLLYTYAAYNTAVNEDIDPKERKTDDDGLITFDKLLVGSYYVEVDGGARHSFFLNAGDNKVTITLK